MCNCNDLQSGTPYLASVTFRNRDGTPTIRAPIQVVATYDAEAIDLARATLTKIELFVAKYASVDIVEYLYPVE